MFVFSLAKSQTENPVLPGSNTEQQLENLADQQDGETEDDSYLQTLVQFRKNPIDLNIADAADLKELRLISDLQIQSFLSYRDLLGKLVSIYELQAVPEWDIEIINRVLPFIKMGNSVSFSEDIGKRLSNGQHSILLRVQQVVEKSDGFLRPDSIVNKYPGSQQRIFFRYKYAYRNLLQFGITGDKDAGEQFFKGNQKSGFDFYSFHFFARKLGLIKFLALGDYTINMGQGLIQWQSLAFKKSPDITAIKRQADIIRPYNSATEFNFMRGGAITLGKKNIEATAFVSVRKLDGSLNIDTTQTNDDFISSILNSGYHRTPAEFAKKNILTQTSYGGNLSYNNKKFHLALNSVHFKYSNPIIKDVQPYNQYSITGSNWYNYSFDYSYTFKNVHFFGEAAMDKRNSKAFVSGLLASLDTKVDASLVYRNIDPQYQAIYGNAFTESTFPSNERGLFLGVSIKPRQFLRVDAYADVFSFPWLKYRVDAPTKGTEYVVQFTYKPNKQVEVYMRFKNENKPINLSGENLPARQIYTRPKQNWRTNVTYNLSKEVSLRSRVEVMWFDTHVKERAQQGFLTYFETKYKPFGKPISLNARLQYFETDGFDSRMYAYESDVLYSFSIPQFIGKGFRYYFNINYDINKKLTTWFRWSQTIYANQENIGSGLDQITGNKRSEVKIQAMYNF